jgi:periplasmic divalent cation tolerance protein
MARAALEQQLAACVHILPIESLYRWQGRLQQEREYQLALHTSASRRAGLYALLRALHPYELPAISVVTALKVHAPYARWVVENTAIAHQRAPRRSAKGGTVHRP